VLVFRECDATDLLNFCPVDAYHVVVQDIRGSPYCHNTPTPFIGDLLYKYDQDDGHALVDNLGLTNWSNGHVAMEGTSNGGIVAYLAAAGWAPGTGASLRGIQTNSATGDLLNYGLFTGGVLHKEIPYPVDLHWRFWKVADFDQDGTPDYVIYSPGTSGTAVWYLNTDLTVRTTASGPTINPGTAWQLQAVADFNHDNIPDYVLYNTTSKATAVWYLRRDLTVSAGVTGPSINPGTPWQLQAVADFNHDNIPDYVLYNSITRQTVVWYLTTDPDGNFIINRGVSGPTINSGWQLQAVADFNHDSTPDYVLYNSTTRQTVVWYLLVGANGISVNGGVSGPTINSGWQLQAVADFNQDGTPDYVLYYPSAQATAIWYLTTDMNGNFIVSDGFFGPTPDQFSWKDYVGLGIWDKYLIDNNDAGKTKVAGLHVGGWFDVFGQGILDTSSRLQKAGGTGALNNQKVVIGPWGHGAVSTVCQAPLSCPSSSTNDAGVNPGGTYDTAWKNCVLGLGPSPCAAWNVLPAVKVYVMNAGNPWATYTTWPPPAQEKTFYFTAGHGLSNTAPPSGSAPPFTSDPSNPCPTLGGINNLISCGTGGTCGPYDQSPIETSRSDLAIFTSGQDPLGTANTIVGRMYADVWIQTPLRDVDVFVRMTDVFPDGHSMLMAQGIQRARYRNGGACPILPLVLTSPTRVRVDLGSTAFVLGTHHKLRVIISASAGPSLGTSLDPLYSVNPQNGDEYIGPTNTPTPGPITVLVGQGQASALVVPQATPGSTPPDHRPPKPTPCPN
jgi:predicted acyl esterase